QLTCYAVGLRFDEYLAVGRRFFVKHLLPAIDTKPDCFILSISRNDVRLLKATPKGCERIHPAGLPTSMQRELNLQGADRGEQVHSAMRGDLTLGKEAGVFHGQGGHRDTVKEEAVEYFQAIDQSIRPVLQQMPWPLVLAGVEYEVAMFRQASDYAHLAEEALYGNFDYTSDQQLHEQAMPIVQRLYEADRQTAFKTYHARLHNQLASDRIEEIVPAAHEGKVDTLFVDCKAEIFGRFDPQSKRVDISSNRDPALDIVDSTITQIIRHSGILYAVQRGELPSAAPMCAIFRY
ncbi:MAG TPA: hypothetical protein VHE81_21305, partial [Lacipirellulaceae bacterium]|nr:hypothetical protein [Lacipirellulaceae bacterium]